MSRERLLFLRPPKQTYDATVLPERNKKIVKLKESDLRKVRVREAAKNETKNRSGMTATAFDKKKQSLCARKATH